MLGAWIIRSVKLLISDERRSSTRGWLQENLSSLVRPTGGVEVVLKFQIYSIFICSCRNVDSAVTVFSWVHGLWYIRQWNITERYCLWSHEETWRKHKCHSKLRKPV